MNVMIFDTETIDTAKKFCYNVGYLIADNDTNEIRVKRDFVIEQIWHNPELFHTAYYADKKPIYIKAMQSRKTIMDKWGYVCQQMFRDIKTFDIKYAFAYNCEFDIGVFEYNCDWFKTINPLDTLEVKDIRDYAYNAFVDDHYKEWCEANSRFTENGNYSTTAETMYQYISGNNDFNEAHTALADSEIEWEILKKALSFAFDTVELVPMKAPKIIERLVEHELTIVAKDKTEHKFKYYSKKHYKSKDKIILY